MSAFYAHSKPGEPPEKWHKLEDHLRATAEQAKEFSEPFGAEDWAYLAGCLHDLGKYSKEFQDRLSDTADNENNMDSKPGRVDHSSAGAQEIVQRYPELGKLMAYCLAGHHAGLLNGKDITSSCLDARLKKSIPECRSASDFFLARIPALNGFPLDLKSISRNNEAVAFRLQMFVRMIFSSLVDADFLDTESFLNPDKSAQRSQFVSLQVMRDRLLDHVASVMTDSQDTLVNRKRREVYEDCLRAADQAQGLFSLTVPTGGGKTLSSLSFALKHATRYNKARIIYAIPFTSIIEQNAEVFRRVLGNDAVLEHHSNLIPAEDDYPSQLNAENWDAPLVVTTNIQFFESFFAARTSRCRRLHNIANSVIILDEAQALPRDLLRPCMSVLKELVEVYHCSIVLCTATQPALHRTDDFKFGLKDVREIVRDPGVLYQELKRVDVDVLPKTDDAVIAHMIGEHPHVLCVVNTRKHARELFELMKGKNGFYHLSALMCPAHRSSVLDAVRKKLHAGEQCRLISTQLIEAGVDIDFPVVFRSLSGIDSMAQAAGRCNREGKLTGRGKVVIFSPQDGVPVGLLRQGAETAESIVRRFGQDILLPEAVREYFLTMYWRAESLDRPGIMARLAEDVGSLNFPFKDVSELFHMIDNRMEPVIIPFNDEARGIIRALRDSNQFRGLVRCAQRYIVNIYPQSLEVLLTKGVVERVQDRFNVLINDHIYRYDIGLDDRDPHFRDIEKDIC